MGFSFLSRKLDHWLPDRFEDNTLYTAETKIRARVLVGLYFASLFLLGTSMLTFLGLHLFSDRNFSIALLCVVFMMGLIALQVVMFYRLANLGASAIIYSITFFGSTLALLILTGGWDSPVKPLYFCSPMISFLVGGRHEGLYTSVLVLITGLVMLAAYKMNFQVFQIIRPENVDIAGAVVWVISINVMISSLLVYDSIMEAYCQSGAADQHRRRSLR